MKVTGTEERLINASIYIKNAMLELKNIPCTCTEINKCNNCILVDYTKNLKSFINDEIRELLE